MDAGVAPLGDCFFLVDPLDGTREFLAGRDEYTVNVAVVRGGVPLAGVICAPAQGILWRGIVGKSAERLRLNGDKAEAPQPIKVRPWPNDKIVAAVSRSHLDPDTQAFLRKFGSVEPNAAGSSVKFCKIAEGVVDLYPRLATTCEWDIAAGHAVLTAAGGVVTNPQGSAAEIRPRRSQFPRPRIHCVGRPGENSGCLTTAGCAALQANAARQATEGFAPAPRIRARASLL